LVYSSSSCRPQLIGCSTYRIINSFYEYLPSLMALSLFAKLVSILANNAKKFSKFYCNWIMVVLSVKLSSNN
jgi:hypothetical protein